MLTKESLKTATTIVVGFGLAFLVVGTSPSFQACTQEHQEHAGGGPLQENVGRFLILYNMGRACGGEWLHSHGEAIIALFTVILGIATWLLWRSTKKLVDGAENTAERQLRAYIVADAVDVDITNLIGDQGEVMVCVKIAIKNTGQTPAHDLRVVSKTELLRHPIEMPFHFTLISGSDPSTAVLGAGESTASESKPATPFDGNAMMVATEPESGGRIYTWGTVTYRDVFGHSHYTNFCSSLVFTESEAISHASEHHNDAS
jgi:hypothetical protein